MTSQFSLPKTRGMRVYPGAEIHRTGTKLYHLQNNYSLPSHAPLHNPLKPIHKQITPTKSTPHTHSTSRILSVHLPCLSPHHTASHHTTPHHTTPHHPLKRIHKQITPPIPFLSQPNPLPTHSTFCILSVHLSCLSLHHTTPHHNSTLLNPSINKTSHPSLPQSNTLPTSSTFRILSVHLRCLSSHRTTSHHITSSHLLKFIHKQIISLIPFLPQSNSLLTSSTSRILSVHLCCLSLHHITSHHFTFLNAFINKTSHPSLPSHNQMHSPHPQHFTFCLFPSLAFHRTAPPPPSLNPSINKPPHPSLTQPNPPPTTKSTPHTPSTSRILSVHLLCLSPHHTTSHHTTSPLLKPIHKQTTPSHPSLPQSNSLPTFSTSRILSVHLSCLSSHRITPYHYINSYHTTTTLNFPSSFKSN